MTFSDLLPPFDQRGMDLSLDRMKRALEALHQPCAQVPAVQVVGTNGKGSIASFIHSGLVAAGLKTGLTTSPHLVTWTERIRVDHRQISAETLRRHLEALQPLAQRERLTPFELLITAALVHFAAARVDWLVLEAGLGGRLDATTAHPHRPLLAVATIGLDHCEHLGHSLHAVAEEKAAAIQKGAVVISGPQPADAAEVLSRQASAMQAELHWVDPLDQSWELGLDGIVQRSNAAVAKAVLERIQGWGHPVTPTAIRTGLARASWPGRLQSVAWRGHAVLIDGAHNPPAAAVLREERQHWPGSEQGVIWILAIQRQKQGPEMLRTLLQPEDTAWIVEVPGHRSWSRDELAEAEPELGEQLQTLPDLQTDLSSSRQVKSVLEHLETTGWPTPPPVIAGSLYLLGALINDHVFDADPQQPNPEP